ncbi:MAG TPA: DNA ligase D [Gemmatimonadales bacterium]|nr:DNA ligase D [Gemmatimonadales bacterium]
MGATRKPAADALSAYRAKRSADATPEPSGIVAAVPRGGHLFVVHQHAARQLHFDLRLEMDGVLRSWAVPKGPSRNQADKRLAVMVEDHPLEYGDFEGIIPEGNYGAGAVIVWDRGMWVPVEDPHAGLEKGKLLFDLRGYKLKGRWTLVKIKKSHKDWLLIKERDAQMTTGDGTVFPAGSVLSGLPVEVLKARTDVAAPLRASLERLGAPRRKLRAKDVELMLAEPRDEPFSKPGWIFELKLDGYRMLASREGGEGKLTTRNGNDLSAAFPEVVRSLAALPYADLVMDGELVVYDDAGRPSFHRLGERARMSRATDVRRWSVEQPASLFLFDLVAAEGFDARGLPLVERKQLLRTVVPEVGPLRYLEHFETDGVAVYAQVTKLGLEGIVAKKADAPYRAGRSPAWLKVRAERTDDFVVVGFTRPKGSRVGFGALHLAMYDRPGGALVYAGRVGTGFDTGQLEEYAAALEGSRRPDPPCGGAVPAGREHVWVEPRLVAEVRFLEWSPDGLLRQPAFLRFRSDKQASECVRQGVGGGLSAVEEAPSLPPTTHHPPPAFTFTNLDKVFWPREGYTKADLIEFYRAIAPWLLPFLEDRPLVLTRYPDGIEGKSFFQKDAPAYAHDFVRTVRMWSAESQRELNYFVCDGEASLLYIANMAAIPLHVWGSRVATLETPDWCILDLDPKDAPFEHVVTVARAVHAMCDEIALPCFVKTSGSTGLHVLVPLGRQCTFEQARTLGGLLARVVAAELPDIATITRQVSKRDGRVYLDYVQNGHGRLLAAPYSVRPVPGALVSAPLAWSEVGPKLSLAQFTIRTMPARMEKLRGDPLLPVLGLAPDLVAALGRLKERLDAARAKRPAARAGRR